MENNEFSGTLWNRPGLAQAPTVSKVAFRPSAKATGDTLRILQKRSGAPNREILVVLLISIRRFLEVDEGRIQLSVRLIEKCREVPGKSIFLVDILVRAVDLELAQVLADLPNLDQRRPLVA